MAKRASEKAAKRRLQFDSSTEEEFADNSSGESSEEVTDTSGVLKIISLKFLMIFIIYFFILFIFGKL